MKEVKIEYSDVLPTFCCGLTAFSNLLQLEATSGGGIMCCGLTAFSNLLQQNYWLKTVSCRLRLDRIF